MRISAHDLARPVGRISEKRSPPFTSDKEVGYALRLTRLSAKNPVPACAKQTYNSWRLDAPGRIAMAGVMQKPSDRKAKWRVGIAFFFLFASIVAASYGA